MSDLKKMYAAGHIILAPGNTIDLQTTNTTQLASIPDPINKRITQQAKNDNSLLPIGLTMAAEDRADYVQYGALKAAEGAVKFGDWSKQMIADFGDSIKPHLAGIWLEAKQVNINGLAAKELGDYVQYGALEVAKGAVKYGDWSKQMIADFGNSIKPHLIDI